MDALSGDANDYECSMDVDNGNIGGNVYDKYGSRNPIARRLMRGFLDAVTGLYRSVAPRSVLEVGCGEGQLAHHLVTCGHRPERFEACDIDLGLVSQNLDPALEWRQASIYELPYADDEFELVLSCEVLEHLDQPAAGLAELARVSSRYVLISTPWEPVWRILNMARGKYLRDLGNTPGHVRHFTRGGLRRLAERELKLLEWRTPLPWSVVLGEPSTYEK